MVVIHEALALTGDNEVKLRVFNSNISEGARQAFQLIVDKPISRLIRDFPEDGEMFVSFADDLASYYPVLLAAEVALSERIIRWWELHNSDHDDVVGLRVALEEKVVERGKIDDSVDAYRWHLDRVTSPDRQSWSSGEARERFAYALISELFEAPWLANFLLIRRGEAALKASVRRRDEIDREVVQLQRNPRSRSTTDSGWEYLEEGLTRSIGRWVAHQRPGHALVYGLVFRNRGMFLYELSRSFLSQPLPWVLEDYLAWVVEEAVVSKEIEAMKKWLDNLELVKGDELELLLEVRSEAPDLYSEIIGSAALRLAEKWSDLGRYVKGNCSRFMRRELVQQWAKYSDYQQRLRLPLELPFSAQATEDSGVLEKSRRFSGGQRDLRPRLIDPDGVVGSLDKSLAERIELGLTTYNAGGGVGRQTRAGGLWEVRVGDWRILAEIGKNNTAVILTVVNRRDLDEAIDSFR